MSPLYTAPRQPQTHTRKTTQLSPWPSMLALVLGFSGLAGLTGAQAQTPGGGADATVEAPLMSGGLGRAADANAMGGGAAAAGLAGGMGNTGIQGLGGRAALPGLQGQVGAGVQNQNVTANLGALPPLGQTQFQRFVQDATGKALPLYGYNLFDRSRFPSLTDVPVPANYVVGPGDEIDLKIWGAVDVAMRLPVDRNGQITVPKVGPITVAGTAANELDAHLKKQVGRVFANFELSANMGRLRSMQIFVVGQARNPGAYTVSSLSTLIGALFESGGPAANGSMRAVQLVRNGKTVTTLDLYKFIHAGETAADARLLPGDVIVVPAAGPRVAVTGATDTPAIFELASAEESIGQLLRYSAGSQTMALCLLGRWRRMALGMLWGGLLALAVMGFEAGPNALLRPLENRYPVPEQAALERHVGVIVLGGAIEHPEVFQARGQVPLGQSAERMTVPVALLRQHPKLALVFSGGEGRLWGTGVSEAELAKAFYAEQGVDLARVTLESGSRTTRENAQQVAKLLGGRCQPPWLLFTSAWHMPRAMAEFEAVGCKVTAYPVDFRTGFSTTWSEYSLARSLLLWQTALHEWLGLWVYGVTR